MNQPDIIFLVLDTQRADRLSCYGYERPTSPHLDQFAAESALFKQGIAPAQWTIPSHASMFTGLYPSTHQVTQSNQALGYDRPHLTELLGQMGYETVGFCNNPLVGILNNGFKRGFDTFYNYGGAIPTVPSDSSHLPGWLGKLSSRYTQFLRRISYPIQNFFGQSDLAFRIATNAWLTPLWSRYINFKGQNERSIKDLRAFLTAREEQPAAKPLFLFINLMETHLPFWPPKEHIAQFAPYLLEDKEAQATLNTWNREAYRWAAPLAEPLSELESRLINDLYDAEVHYQDSYLGQLFATLAGRRNRENTLTVVVGDHGDGFGEHGYFGHAFVAYQELLHVPLLLHWPAQIKPSQHADPVSTRRVYHTMLAAAGPLPNDIKNLTPAEIRQLSLRESLAGREAEKEGAYAEVFPPLNFVKTIRHRQPELLEQFRCLAVRRALVQGQEKLISIDNRPEELYNLQTDYPETNNLAPDAVARVASLNNQLDRLAALAELQRETIRAGEALDLEADDGLLQHLRGLGYID